MTEHMKKNELSPAEMIHEIKNPLTTVKGLLQLLKPYLVMIEKERYVDVAISEINRADELLTAYLGSNQSFNRTSLLCVNTLLEEMKLLFEREASVHQIKFSMRLDPLYPKINICRNEFKQVLVNLIKNAIEALHEMPTEKTPTIDLKTHVQGNRINITVQDNGIGMDQFTLCQLFTPFYTEKTSGTGLGLSICKKIIEKHEGVITVESGKGIGTTFQISFPAVVDVN